jgi:6-phosphogluconolactonase/glucosamine-6-phosphate isomerase/deaminase
MTLTLAALARARRVVFTISGASKRDAWEKIRAGADIPATRVRAAEVIWIVDREAAGG